MFKINDEIVDFLKELCDECPNLVVKGGSSLLIRNYFLSRDDYRYSSDIDITVIGQSKNRGPYSQYDPKKNRLDDFLERKNIKHTCELIRQRRAICKININGITIDLESSVPQDYEYTEYDEIGGIRLVKLSKVLADKIMILIEYQFDGTDLFGPYLRHAVDIFMMEDWYDYDMLSEKDEIVQCIKTRIAMNSSRYSVLYKDISGGWNEVVKNILLKDGSPKLVNEFISNMERSNKDVIGNKVIKSKAVEKISLLLKEAKDE